MRFRYTIYEGTPSGSYIVEQDVIEVVTERDAKDYADECLRQYHESFEDKTYFAEIERVSYCETF